MSTRILQSDILRLFAMMRPQNPATLRKIRLGNAWDGGYVVPDDLEGLSAVLSIGVGHDVSFDHHLAERGVQVYQYDHTVEGPPTTHRNFHFHRKGWADESAGDAISLAQILADHELGASFDMILKVDIEGAEWGALQSVTDAQLAHFRIITFELHGLCHVEEPANLDLFLRRIALLTRQHTPVHVHANNFGGFRIIEGVPVPDVLELTLLRNDRDRFVPSLDPIPGPLDAPNAPERPDIVLRPF
jgi:Methyltransferase FkbM domain